jgi:ligand-binding SRPBCC domain-containing protein
MPAIFKAPAFILKLVLGEMSTMILSSANIKPTVLTNAGFKFKFPDIKSALDDLLAYCQPHGTRIFTARQWIKGSPSENFPFFSAAENLETITPPWLNFRIVAKSTPDVREGMLIDYKLKIKGVPVKWRTRIENWDPPHKFVDTQLRGPYKTWHHTHRFEQLGQGTLMTDVVRYRMHAWPIGDFALPMVKNDVNSIFRYRRQIIEKILSSKPQ